MSLNVDTLVSKLEAHHLLDSSTVPLFKKLVIESDSDFVAPEPEPVAAVRLPSDEKLAKLDATATERGIGIAPEPEAITDPVAEETPAEGEAVNG